MKVQFRTIWTSTRQVEGSIARSWSVRRPSRSVSDFCVFRVMWNSLVYGTNERNCVISPRLARPSYPPASSRARSATTNSSKSSSGMADTDTNTLPCLS